MKRCLIPEGFVMACLICSSGCAELLLDGKEYHLDEGGAGAGGDGGPAVLICDDGLTACDSACVRTDSDARHCGACGRDCFGAACSAGMCEAEVIASDIPEPHAFAVDDTHVYWTAGDGTVQRAPKAGGSVEMLVSGQNDPGAILAGDKRIFWINRGDGTLLRLRKDGKGKAKVLFDAGETGGLARLAFDGDSIYFSRKLGDGEIRRAAANLGDDEDAVSSVFVADQPGVSHLRLLGAGLTWSGLDTRGNGGYVRFRPQMKSDLGTLLTLAAGEEEITALAAAGGSAVWADASGRIRSRNLAEGGAITVVDGQDIRGLAADEQRVFWSTASGTLRSHTLDSGETRVLAFDIDAPGPLAVDATHVYVLRTGPAGGIVRVAR